MNPNYVTLTYILYGLHLFSVVNGLLSSAFIVTAFLSGWPSLLAVVLNYWKRSEVQGTLLASHFEWQIKTFWVSLLLLLIAGVLMVTVILIPISILLLLGTGIWILYRMLRGILNLQEGSGMPL